MIPSKDEAMKLINEAYDMNPGPWGEYEDMWDKLFLIYDYFHEMEIVLAE